MLDAVADALQAEVVVLEAAGCVGSSRRESVARVAARLRHHAELPPYVADMTVSLAVAHVEYFASVRARCHREQAPVAATRAGPAVPACARAVVEGEQAAADLLEAWGHPDAADALAAVSARWEDTRCPRAGGGRCDCGSGPAAPAHPYLGPDPTLDVAHELGRWWAAGCNPEGVPSALCPGGCVPVAGRERRPPLVETAAAHGLVFYRTDAAPTCPRDPAVCAFEAAAAGCGPGAAEWLGAWAAWDSLPGSRCLADAAQATLAWDRWAAVERSP